MIHPDTTELGLFAAGKLPGQRLLEIDAHVCGCAECRAELAGLPAVKKMASDLGTVLLGAADCPEYEELSAYVQNELGKDEARRIASHTNLCELCSRDVRRIAELRSHALMRPAVTVSPGMSGRLAKPVIPVWRRILAGAGVAGILTVAAFSFAVMNRAPQQGQVVKNPTVVDKPIAHNDAPAPSVKPNTHGNTPPVGPKPHVNPPLHSAPNPGTVALLHDGKYQVVKHNNEMYLAKTGPGAPRTALEARIAAAIDQKLKTGSVRPDSRVRVAMAEIVVTRAQAGTTDPTAPKPVSPMGKMLISDRPTLKWSTVDQAESYRVRVFDEQGNALFDQMTDKTSLTLPKSLARGGVYKWQVGVRFSEVDKWADSRAVKFGVISTEDYASINRLRSTGSHLALGAAYESFGLADEAAREYAAVRAANPRSELARKLH